jgi:hypothetical protein
MKLGFRLRSLLFTTFTSGPTLVRSEQFSHAIATAQNVAGQLESVPQLEWSPAVIGLCKSIDPVVVGQIIRPLAATARGENLSGEKNDKDIGRVAAFCVDRQRKPPELGAFAHFMQTVIHSQEPRQTSTLIRCLLRLAGQWTGSTSLLYPTGLHRALTVMAGTYSNRAAHIDELGKSDFLGCRELTVGS